jgi:hypothetical protein
VRRNLELQLDLVDAMNGVVSTNSELRRHGRPYANHRTTDTGVAVYFTRKGREQASHLRQMGFCPRQPANLELRDRLWSGINSGLFASARWRPAERRQRPYSCELTPRRTGARHALHWRLAARVRGLHRAAEAQSRRRSIRRRSIRGSQCLRSSKRSQHCTCQAIR